MKQPIKNRFILDDQSGERFATKEERKALDAAKKILRDS